MESVVKNADAFLPISQVKSGVKASGGDVNLSVVMHTCSLPVRLLQLSFMPESLLRSLIYVSFPFYLLIFFGSTLFFLIPHRAL